MTRNKPTSKSGDGGRIEVENVNVPGYKQVVDSTKYQAMKRALLEILPPQPKVAKKPSR